MPTLVATAVLFRLSGEMCIRSELLLVHLLPSWVMELWSPEVMPTMVAAAV